MYNNILIGNMSAQLNPGDFIGFKPGTDAHYLENLTNSEVHLLMISSNNTGDQVNYVYQHKKESTNS